MLANIREILIISSSRDIELFNSYIKWAIQSLKYIKTHSTKNLVLVSYSRFMNNKKAHIIIIEEILYHYNPALIKEKLINYS